MKMDRYFYSIELDEYGHKLVHLSGNIYMNDVDETDTNYRIAEWTGMYITLQELQTFLLDDTFYDYVNPMVNYLDDITEIQALSMCREYFDGEPGIELHIKNINVNTPCGDYWFE